MRAITAKAARNSRSKTSVSLTLAAVATHATGTPSPSTATFYFVPRLILRAPLGPVRRIGPGEIAPAFGAHRAAIQAQLEHRVLKRCSAPSTCADARGL